MTMRSRLLGRSGLRVSELGLGAMRFGEEDEARRIAARSGA
jgi:aryl-alcohol dehydrogenase-like predicted oxidoreductase